MKTNLFNSNGEKTKQIELPSVFSVPVRTDLIAKVVETKKIKQPHSPSPLAGEVHVADGVVRHKRHSWKSGYGRGASRVPRKVMSNRGTQFHWVGAEVPQTRGGRRAHPPKVEKMLNYGKLNKKEVLLALKSTISATASLKFLYKRYSSIQEKNLKVELPFVVESHFVKLKTKQLWKAIEKILGEELFNVAMQKKNTRAGKGTMRGRRYKKSSGILLVTGNKEKINMKGVETTSVPSLSITQLADGNAPGRLTIYTEEAIKDLGEKLR